MSIRFQSVVVYRDTSYDSFTIRGETKPNLKPKWVCVVVIEEFLIEEFLIEEFNRLILCSGIFSVYLGIFSVSLGSISKWFGSISDILGFISDRYLYKSQNFNEGEFPRG